MKAGRRKEIQELKDFGVFEFIRAQDASRIKQVRCRWVDRLKKGACRSRFVAMEFANSIRDDLYAGTPLLGVVRLLFSEAATHAGGKAPTKLLSAADISCAFMHAKYDGELVLALPPGMAPEGCKAKLIGAINGTRKASLLWQRFVEEQMRAGGFLPMSGCPQLYQHP